MEHLEKIGWYQNPEKHALNKERYLNDELEKAFQIYEWLNDKTYLKSFDELKAAGFSGTQRYHLGRLKHFEKDLKAYFGDESVDKDKLKNFDIMSSKNEKETKMLSNVVSDDKINYAHLKNIAQELKEVKDETEFYALFGFKNRKTRGNVKTPIKEVEIDLQEAWQHLQNNSKKENRLKLAGGILPTLQTPNVVSVDKNGTYFFIKPLKMRKAC